MQIASTSRVDNQRSGDRAGGRSTLHKSVQDFTRLLKFKHVTVSDLQAI